MCFIMLEKQLPYKYKVYDVIKKDILCGSYSPGDVLNERALSGQMGISRTPIREALQMLAQDCWVQLETYKGAVVREYDLRYLQEISRIRMALEVCAIEDAAANITDKDIAELEEIQNKQTGMIQALKQQGLESFDVLAFIFLDRSFHCHIYDLSHNRELIHLLRNYYDLFQLMGTQAVMNTVERKTETLQEHQMILDTLKRRDIPAAVQAMRTHMEITEKNMRSHMRQKRSPTG